MASLRCGKLRFEARCHCQPIICTRQAKHITLLKEESSGYLINLQPAVKHPEASDVHISANEEQEAWQTFMDNKSSLDVLTIS